MYNSYFKIGWRNLSRHKGYSLINIGGLAIGMAVTLLIALWINDEVQFNKYHDNYGRIARVMRHLSMNGRIMTTRVLPNALGEELRTTYGGQFQRVVMAALDGDHILSVGDEKVSLRGQFMDADAPEMFSLRMLEGNRSALQDHRSVIISASTASVLFGDDNPMGKLVRIDNTERMDVRVTGVYADLPYHSEFYGLKFIAPFELAVASSEWMQQISFTNDFLNIYVAISDRTTFEAAGEQIRNAILNNVRDNPGYVVVNPQLALHPMKDWHLRSQWKDGVIAAGAIEAVWMFGVVGAFVMLLACINFMNLSTARSEKRAKEVGIRKAVGSARAQLVHQFFSESFLVVLLSFAVSLFIVALSLNAFNELAGKEMVMPWTNVYFWIWSFVFIAFTGLLAGSYPAVYLSSFNAVKVLKGSLRVGKYASMPRKVLVVIQFTASVTLIIGTVIVARQIQFAKNRPVGYTRDGLVTIQKSAPDFQGKFDVLQAELKNTGAVTEIAESSSQLTSIASKNGGFDWVGRDPAFIPELATLTVTPEYGKVVGWQFVDGRDFSRDVASDSAGFVINEAAAKLFGFQQPVGETVRWSGGWRSRFSSFRIIGVVKDMVMESPYSPPVPSVFFLSRYGTNWISLRINPQVSAGEAISRIESVFKRVVPSVPFEYSFGDVEYAAKFVAEERIGKLSSVFAVLAIFISSLGLFGLSSFVAEQRTKEIGIRKVVGASVFNLWQMLSKDFVVLVTISCAVAIPLAYYFLSGWLDQYEYRTTIAWWIFPVVSLGAMLVTLLTVSYQAIRAAMIKPVRSLRSE